MKTFKFNRIKAKKTIATEEDLKEYGKFIEDLAEKLFGNNCDEVVIEDIEDVERCENV